jgi:lipoate-protein ligase A
LHRWVTAALRAANVPAELAPTARKEIPGQCFAGAEQYDVLLGGRKIAGAAQRRTRDGLLIQGSIQNLPAGADRELWQQQMRANATIWNEFELSEEIKTIATELTATKYSQASYNELKRA